MKSAAQILDVLNRSTRGSGQTLADLMCVCCAADTSVTGVAMAMMNEGGHQGMVGASDQAATTLESLQFELGEGPCLDASSAQHPILTGTLGLAADRWPAFVPAALAAGVAAIFAFPLQVGAIRLGILDLYQAEPGTLDPHQLTQALEYADACVVLLLQLQGLMPPGTGLHPDLGSPLEDRAEVHQATGVIAVQAAVGLAEALLLLRARAFSDGNTMRETARAVVDGTLRFDVGTGDD